MSRNVVLACLGVVALSLFYVFKTVLIEPPTINPSHEFQTDRAFARLERILGDEAPHPVDSDANDAVRERLIDEIEALGFAPEIRDDFACVSRWARFDCARVQNVMFWVGEPRANAILLASHYDSVPAGPGASDDGAGVAASLEIAAVLKDNPIEQSVLVLITDGEEAGLLGARSFVDTDPYAPLIGAVVNLEARGVEGPVSMFQTGRPNGRDIAVLKSDAMLPVANSVTADIYELMPNDTDASFFLELDIDLANYAFVNGDAFYHTPEDKLANMDKRSLFHTGASGLAAVRAFDGTKPEVEGNWIYTDYLGLFSLQLPSVFGVPLILLGGVLAGFAAVRIGGGGIVRAIVSAPLAILLGGGLAVVCGIAIGALRPEASFAGANPWALTGLHGSAVMLGLAFSFWLLWPRVDPLRVLFMHWAWLAILGVTGSVFLPGMAILFCVPLAIVGIAAVLTIFRQDTFAKVLLWIAGVLLLLTHVRMSAFGESALGLENSAAFALLLLFGGLVTLPLLVHGDEKPIRGRWFVPVGTAGLMLVFGIAALVVPAYSPMSPRYLPILHVQEDGNQPVWAIRTSEDLPAGLQDIADFRMGELSLLSGRRFIAEAPELQTSGLEVETELGPKEDGSRKVAFNVTAPDVDELMILLDGPSGKMTSISVNGALRNIAPEGVSTIQCRGRSCRDIGIGVQLTGGSEEPTFRIIGLQHGLGDAGIEFLAARPADSLTVQSGDMRVTGFKMTVSAENE